MRVYLDPDHCLYWWLDSHRCYQDRQPPRTRRKMRPYRRRTRVQLRASLKTYRHHPRMSHRTKKAGTR